MMTRKTAVEACIVLGLVALGAPEAFAQDEDYGPTPQLPSTQPPPGQAAGPAGPIASTDGEQSGMRVDVTELKRGSGGTVTLKFTLINGSEAPFTLADNLRGAGAGYNVSGVYLLDTANRKKYHVIMDAEQNCVCSTNVPYTVEAGTSVNLWAKFPAPPAETSEVGVVVPHFIPMDGVPIAP